MAVSLQKGQKVSLTKETPGLSRIIVGLGWDEAKPAKKGLFGFGGKSKILTVMRRQWSARMERFRAPRMWCSITI